MKSLFLYLGISIISMSLVYSQSWNTSNTNVIYSEDTTVRVGVGISNAPDFDSPGGIYGGAGQVKLLVESTRSGAIESETIENVGNIGHLLRGNFGDTTGVWSTLGGPGVSTFANKPIYGLKIQYNEYAVNLDMADRAIVDNGFGASPDDIIDAVLFWDPGVDISDFESSVSSEEADLIIGPTKGGGQIEKRIWFDNVDDINITSGVTEFALGSPGGGAGTSLTRSGDIRIETPDSEIGFGDIFLDPGIRTGTVGSNGLVKVIGSGTYTGSWTHSSDKKFKKNIKKIDSARNLIQKLNGKIYQMNREAYPKMGFSRKPQFGFIAQEVAEVIPHLVDTIQEGNGEFYLAVNYIDMIPVIVEAMKEQQSAMDSLKGEIARLTKELSEDEQDEDDVESSSARLQSGASPVDASAIAESLATQSELFQNTPNPFSNSTEIRFSVAEGAESASLYIYDMNGLQLKSIPINGRGESSLSISGGELKAGMYLYSLIVDGREVETKRMILTR